MKRSAADKAYYRRTRHIPMNLDAKLGGNAEKVRAYFVELGKTPTRAEFERFCAVRRLYGMEPDVYAHLLEKQDGRCALCGRSLAEGNRWGLDHDHSSGKVRGAVHMRCNRFIGFVEQYPEMLEGIFRYLDLNHA